MLKGWIGRLFPYLLVALIAGAAGGALGAVTLNDRGIQQRPVEYQRREEGQRPERIVYPEGENPGIVRAVAEKNIQAVVSIITVEIRRDEMFNPTEERGVGSGVIVEPNGYILTNDHVVGKNAREINVLFENGQQMPAVVLWQDSALDLALIRVDATGLPYAELGDSDRVNVGDIAVAIGSPLGLRFQRTVTSGVISALNRSLMVGPEGEEVIMEDLIQTDASINPGNSGGPLLNAKGQVIGINTAKASEAEGIGFAVPINIAKPVIKQVVEKGFFRPMYLGIDGYDREIAGYHNSDIDIQKGIYVIRVHNNTPASAAGIREGDIILELDGQPLDSMIKMRSILFGMDRPKKVSVLIKRDGKTITKQVEPAPRPEGY
ncbi:MAG: trypsin-like serine protease [Clostridiales bacterium]|jgi:serine protease Do|nr:trypsin-like serine protease [Clostridiales bacterium]HOC09359.1 trypsin-like peptidase domain-containing protein [Bacillota bacterium]HQD41717.1 trypsin-like peptidase domain-containing protein [Bacillota bacterium]